MLIRFTVENYRSFNERQVFSMAAGKHTRHKEQVVVANGKRLLKAGVVFGANASGKSNLIKAINFGKNVALKGIKNSMTMNRHFRIDPIAINRPGVFQYDFLSNGHIYSYGFAISYTKNIFLSEWLYLCDDNKEICIFDRAEGENISTHLSFTNAEDEQRFTIYADDVTDNTSFLAEICSHKLRDIEEFAAFFDVLDWFTSLVIIFPQTKYRDLGQLFKNDENDSFGKLLNYFDTGIEEVITAVKPIEEVLTFLPDNIKNDVIHGIQEGFDEDNKKATTVDVTIIGKRFSFTKKDGVIVGSQLTMNHGNPTDLFELDDESDGTRRLFDLIPLYQKGKENYVIFVDEIDRSFHTKLTLEFLQKFFEKTEGIKSQIIVTLHDSNVMNLNIFRQDEIWFVERKEDHSSEIYSLNRFKERFDHSVAKDYLLGRYGAVPNFGIEDWNQEEVD
ncbi:MAG: AAA family ATPase [Butyrivibrio sp.]|nr:AAA family ATPase [Acetatifactor muris]MCM1559541.1 AAA family ATPase [Butyrivibrio sp.]